MSARSDNLLVTFIGLTENIYLITFGLWGMINHGKGALLVFFLLVVLNIAARIQQHQNRQCDPTNFDK